MLLPVVLLLSLVAAMAFVGHRSSGLASPASGGATDQDKARFAAEAGLHRAIVQMHSKGCGGTYPIFLLAPVQDTAFDSARYYAYSSPLSGSPVTVYSTGTYGDASLTLTRSDVPMHQSATFSMTLQPGAVGVDTYVQSGSSANNGAAASLSATASTAMPLLQFDLSAVPVGAHVTSAVLSAYASSGSNSGQVAVHRVTRNWTEAATWASADGSTAWSQAGGDLMSTAVATASYAGAPAWLNWDLTPLVDRWVKGSLPNQGVQVRAAAALSGLTLASSDNATASLRPKLTLTFLPPCGWTPPDTTVVLSPLADTDIDKPVPTTNFGLQPDLYLSYFNESRTLLSFDTTAIATGMVVTKATLRLYFGALAAGTKTGATLSLRAHAVTAQWGELEATWKKRKATTNWTAQGGDYRSTATATLSFPANSTPGQWVEFDITPLVQEWIDGVTVNNGVLLLTPTSSVDELIFNSREALLNKPELVVTYH